MIRTIGLVETIPERLSIIEASLRELEKEFSKHQGEQEQGVKRTGDRFKALEDEIAQIRRDFEDCRKRGTSQLLAEDIKKLEDQIKPLSVDLADRQETRRTIGYYAKELFLAFLRYAMLPLTIAVLIFLGINPTYIPWYKSTSPQAQVEQELWNRTSGNEISERNVQYLLDRFGSVSIISTNPDPTQADQDYREKIRQRSCAGQYHLFIWLPTQQSGFIRLYDKNGRQIGETINIIRGL